MPLQVSLDQLDAFAEQLWKQLGNATVVLFHGAMGAGKTTLIGALCRAKGVKDSVSSPTFSIINEYQYQEHGVLKKLFHLDLYRLKNEEEAAQAGVEDAVYSGALCFVEWPEKAPRLFDEHAVHVVIEPVTSTERKVHILSDAAFGSSAVRTQP